MFKIDKLQNLHNSINKKNFNLQNELAKCRKEYDLNPEYLFLMGLFLKLELAYHYHFYKVEKNESENQIKNTIKNMPRPGVEPGTFRSSI